MATSASVLENDGLLSRIDRKLVKIEYIFALLSGLAVFSLMVLAVVSVSGRHSINQPLPGYVDWIEQLMPLIAFMGVAFVQRNGGHIRMDIFVSMLRGRALWFFEAISVLLMIFVVVLLVWGSWSHFGRSFDFAAPLWSRDSSMDIALPIWPAKLLAPVAFSFLLLRLVLQFVIYARAIWHNDPAPAGVPMIEDAATQAAKEASTVSG
ncbi:MAG: TRAP transporter small permease [Pseudomonadota bacterium]